MPEHLRRQMCGSEQRELKQQQGKPCGAQGTGAMDHSQDLQVSLLSLGGLSPSPLPEVPLLAFGMPSFPSPAAASVVKTDPWEGNLLKGSAAGVIVVLHLWLRGCCKKCTGVRKCEKENNIYCGEEGKFNGPFFKF